MGNKINDYTSLEQVVGKCEIDGTFTRSNWQSDNKVSIIIPTYNQETQLKMCLGAISQQSYGMENIEVVIADDGGVRGTGSSLNYVAQNDFPFDIKYVWQPDDGFRLSKIRNKAIDQASHETIICLDSDMIIEDDYIENVMKWHYAAKQAGTKVMTSNERAFVNPEDMTEDLIYGKRVGDVKTVESARFGTKEDWRHSYFQQSSWLKDIPLGWKDSTYMIGSRFVGGACSFSKADYYDAGRFDESFNGWGGEDTEFGVRLFEYFNIKMQEKMFFVPLAKKAFHLEHGGNRISPEAEKKRKEYMWERINAFRAEGSSSRPKVSVYIPCFNQERFIRKSIESVINQNVRLSDLEIVVGDDGSTDRSHNILEELKSKYSNLVDIRIIGDGINRGLAENTNRTIRACKGKYIVQLDADDELMPDAIYELYKKMKKSPDASIVFSDCIDVDANGRRTNHWSCNEYTDSWHRKHRCRSDYESLIKQRIRYGMRINHARMFRRESFFKTEGVNTKLVNAVDYDLFMKLIEVGKPIHIKKRLYLYNKDHGNNTSITKYFLQMANTYNVQALGTRRDKKRKEMFIYEHSDVPERFDLMDPDLFSSNLLRILEEQEEDHKVKVALEQELESCVRFFRWVNPEESYKQIKTLKRMFPDNDVAKYYEATFLEKKGLLKEAIKILKSVSNPNAFTSQLLARIMSASLN